MDALVSGPIVLDYAFKDILVNRWQAKIDAILSDLGLAAGLLTVPDAGQYALGRVYQRDANKGVRIARDNTIPNPEDMRLAGATIRANTLVRVNIMWCPIERQDAYRDLSIYAHAAREVLMQYWRAYHSTGSIKAYILGINDATEEAASSLYEQRQLMGLTDLGAGLESNHETCEIVLAVEHKIAHPVSYTP